MKTKRHWNSHFHHNSSHTPNVKSKIRRRTRRLCHEPLESRLLLAADPIVLFSDSFESGQWSGQWVEDSQNDWFDSSQRATDGARSAEVDGWASNAALSLANPLDLTGYASAELTFSWYIESGFDGGEYIALDLYDGTTWSEVATLRGNVDQENAWHHETIAIDGDYLGEDFQLRFRAKVSSSREDGNVDNVRITGVPGGPPEISASDATIHEGNSLDVLVAAGSGGLDKPLGMAIGADGNLYVASSSGVLRYDGSTGNFLGTFAATGAAVGYTAFGPDGNLYVSSGGSVLKYRASDGAYLGVFATPLNQHVNGVSGMTFGPDGDLFVSSGRADKLVVDKVLRYQGPNSGSPGSFAGDFIVVGAQGETLDLPRGLTFGPDNNLYVTGRDSHSVARYDGATGVYMDEYVAAGIAGLSGPHDLAFGPDGNLYVGSGGSTSAQAVFRFQGPGGATPGALIDRVGDYASGVDGPRAIVFDAIGNMYVANINTDEVLRYSRGVTVSLSSPSGEEVTVDYATNDGSAQSSSDYTVTSGTLTFEPGQTAKKILLVANNDGEVETNESFTLDLSIPTGGATIADAQGVATIVDEDILRGITVDDVVVIEGDDTPHFRGTFVTTDGGQIDGLVFNSGMLYTSMGAGNGSGQARAVNRYDGTTGEFDSEFVSPGPLLQPRDLVFHDGFLYVASPVSNEVIRFNAVDGMYDRTFVTAGSGGIDGPWAMEFGPDVNNDNVQDLYVSGFNNSTIVRYDGVTGLPLEPTPFLTYGVGGLNGPYGLTFDPTQSALLVASQETSNVLKYDAITGDFLGVAASGLNLPSDVKFGPDDGLLYVASRGDGRITRWNTSGAYVDDFVPTGSGGMSQPHRMAFGPDDGDLYVLDFDANGILRFGRENEAVLTATLSSISNFPVTFEFTTADSSAVAGSDYAFTSGSVTIPAGFAEPQFSRSRAGRQRHRTGRRIAG